MPDEIAYVCNACGEEIVVPIDHSQGSSQEYVEDCPVCCRPNLIHIEIDEDGEAKASAESGARRMIESLCHTCIHGAAVDFTSAGA